MEEPPYLRVRYKGQEYFLNMMNLGAAGNAGGVIGHDWFTPEQTQLPANTPLPELLLESGKLTLVFEREKLATREIKALADMESLPGARQRNNALIIPFVEMEFRMDERGLDHVQSDYERGRANERGDRGR